MSFLIFPFASSVYPITVPIKSDALIEVFEKLYPSALTFDANSKTIVSAFAYS